MSKNNFSTIPEFVNRGYSCSYYQPQEYWIADSLTTLSYRSENLAAYLHEIACSVSRLIQSDWTVVTLCDGETGNVIASSLDLEDQNPSFSAHGTLAGEVAQTGQPILVKDIRRTHQQYKLPGPYLAYLGVPLQSPFGNHMGTICSFFEQPQQFSEEMVQRVRIFAERAAIALDNHQLYQRQQQLLNELSQTNQQLQIEIQERQQIEQEVMRLAEIGELAAMIVHEVRNPLTTILLGLMALKKSDLTEAIQLRLALALEEADRLQRLLNEILLYTKRQSLQCSELEVNHWVREMGEITVSMPAAAGRSVEIVSTIPEAWISGDPDKLKQIFINLMKNACEAAVEGSVVTWSVKPGKTSTHICICCHNEGEPIPPELLKKLGTPFCTTKPEGNGLGLAIVRRIVEAHQGEFTIQSEPELGTSVCIHLPIIQPRSR